MSHKRIRIGITGQPGFLGTHLFNTLGLYPEKYERIPFEDDFFKDRESLEGFCSRCDAIVHLAAVNRHKNPDHIQNTNISLVNTLLQALDKSGSNPHLLYSSSIQEDLRNIYGKSKKAGRELMAAWAGQNGTAFTGFVFPNIFGPYGNPYYNSFVATFSHQLINNETPRIEVDNSVPLLYVDEVVDHILKAIDDKTNNDCFRVGASVEKKVTSILEQLQQFNSLYFEQGILPDLPSGFDVNLFNTFRSFIDLDKHNPVKLTIHKDQRGSFVETIKTGVGGQFSFSTTKPGITRGDHYHTRKIERFTVIKGEAQIQLRKVGTDKIHSYRLSGDNASFIDMPIWYTHNITNTGSEELYTLFWINEFFNPDDSDTYYEKVNP